MQEQSLITTILLWYLVGGTLVASLYALFDKHASHAQLGLAFWIWPLPVFYSLWGIVLGLGKLTLYLTSLPFYFLQQVTQKKPKY